jgi:adenylate cyclase
MTTERYERKLTAILSADVKGYSRLMGEDEEATIRTLTANREMIADLIQKHRGRVVDSPGDNVLAEFKSVVDAVSCAVEIQEELKARNAEVPENRKMEFRIGINLGDVVVAGERIYGDGVNIAARVEGLAAAGGICISGTVYDQVGDKLAFGFDYLGEQAVKNIRKPVRVYRVQMETAASVPEVSRDLELPDKPSIAVLPFVNMTGDTEQEYFSDGMTEDLITDLSKISGLFVIAHNSVFTYKGKSVRVEEVGRGLGVRYVLEGSVRKSKDRVRITAQLVDTTTGGHLWAERYDRDLEDIFALQDEVTQKIVSVLAVKLTEDEQERLLCKYTSNMEAYDYFLRGSENLYRFTKEANAQARQMFEEAVALDPEYALAYSLLAHTHFMEWAFGWSQNPQTVERAFELGQRAIALNDSLSETYCVLGDVYLFKKQHEQAIAALEKAIALDPNGADGYAGLGNALSWAGRPEEAIGLVKKAMRLNPIYPVSYLWHLGHAYFLTGQYEEAITGFKRVLNRNPEFPPAHVFLAVIYIKLGRTEEAGVEATEASSMSPYFSLEACRQNLPYKNQAVLERILSALRKAGLK